MVHFTSHFPKLLADYTTNKMYCNIFLLTNSSKISENVRQHASPSQAKIYSYNTDGEQGKMAKATGKLANPSVK